MPDWPSQQGLNSDFNGDAFLMQVQQKLGTAQRPYNNYSLIALTLLLTTFMH